MGAVSRNGILEALKVQPLTDEEKEQRHILKRLFGPIASCKEATRNQRHYNRELWERALGDDIFKEKIKTKSLFLELGHPRDRSETDMACVCACIPEIPQIIDDDLCAVVDVLDTPNGRLLNTLIDYGFVPGISSRGEGDVIGDEVDPSTFFLETWDIVQIPALKKARLGIAESLENKPSLQKALCEELEKATDKDRELMESTLRGLNIDVGTTNQMVDDIHVATEEVAADNDGATIVMELQEALKKNKEYEGTIKALQENLSVCYTKERELQERLGGYKQRLQSSMETAKKATALAVKVKSLEEQLAKQSETISDRDAKIKALGSKLENATNIKSRLTESFETKKQEVNSLKSQISSLQEDVASLKEESKETETRLTEQIEDLKKDSSIKNSEYRAKLSSANALVEKYKRVAKLAVNKYIESQALKLGVSANEIKNRLSENYSFDEIDKVCEEITRYRVSLNSLPFDLREDVKSNRVKVSQAKDPILPDDGLDDEIDDWLKSQANI